MRFKYGAFATAVALLAATSSCGYDTGDDLPAVLEAITPVGATPLASCGGSEGLIDLPSRECTFLAPGQGGAVTAAVARALREQGFAAACSIPGEIAAVRDNVRVLVEVAQHGSFVASGSVANVFDTGYRPRGSRLIPVGSVVVDIGVSRLSEASASQWKRRSREPGRCDAALQRPDLVARCVDWWNGERQRREEAHRLGAQPSIDVRPDWGIERSSCAYTIRTNRGYLSTTWRFEDDAWIRPRLHPIKPPASFRANARMDKYGWLTS